MTFEDLSERLFDHISEHETVHDKINEEIKNLQTRISELKNEISQTDNATTKTTQTDKMHTGSKSDKGQNNTTCESKLNAIANVLEPQENVYAMYHSTAGKCHSATSLHVFFGYIYSALKDLNERLRVLESN